MSTVVSPQQRGSFSSPLAWRRWWLGIDSNEDVIAFAQTFIGQSLIHAVLLGCLVLMPGIRLSHVAVMAVALVLCWAFPARRLLVIALTGAAYFLLRPFKAAELYDYVDQSPLAAFMGSVGFLPADLMLVPLGLVFLAFAAAMMWNQTHRFIAPISDRPLIFMASVAALLALATVTLSTDHPLYLPIWLTLAFLTQTFFFLGYVLIDMRGKTPLPAPLKFGFMRPVWAGFATPIKGPAYFVKHESKSDRDLAVARLKGLKLVVWASILYLTYELGFNRLLYGELAFPRLSILINAAANGEPVNLITRWSAVAAHFLYIVIVMGASVHALVAVVRVAGFAIPRGMVRPLASRTIAEFWGRYLFYFKELLVDFFFYPAFRRYFKKSPRLRLAFATFCAAFIGNVFFDFFLSLPFIALGNGQQLLDGFVSYCVYAGLLTLGIIWSQQFQRVPKPDDGWLRYDVLPRVQVITFFALLLVIDDSSAIVPIDERLSFLFSLFGVTL